MTDYPKHEWPELTQQHKRDKQSIALLTVLADGTHQVNLFDGVKLPAGEYVLAIDPRDAHGPTPPSCRPMRGDRHGTPKHACSVGINLIHSISTARARRRSTNNG